MQLFGRPFGFWLLTIVGLTVMFAMVYVLRFKYWQPNLRLISSSWNLYRVMRSNGILDSSATAGQCTTDVCSQAAFFKEFCEYWKNDRARPQEGSLQFRQHRHTLADIDDERMLRQVNRVPLEYTMFTTLTADGLREHWQKFVTNRCSSYYDKLICPSGIVFDWTNKRLTDRLSAERDAPP